MPGLLPGTGMFSFPFVPSSSTQQPPSLLDIAKQQFPVLNNLDLNVKMSPGQGGSNLLEFWKPGEAGDKSSPRPGELPLDSPGLEIYSNKVRPIDIMADVASHHLIETDPKIKKTYEIFEKSITPQQDNVLRDQYQYAKKNEGETRSYEDWKSSTGLPAMFRGYAFNQWPDEFNNRLYTPQQKQLFDAMMKYLRGQ